MSVAVLQAYRVALDPTRARDLERHAGAARFAYNWALATVRANIDQRAAERPYGLGGEDLTPVLGWNLPRRAGNQVNDQVAPWWTECSVDRPQACDATEGGHDQDPRVHPDTGPPGRAG
jgi:putative transposase